MTLDRLDAAVAAIPDVRAALAELCGAIPAGRLVTFGDIADALGDRRAALGVANALEADRPGGWHRVVSATGRVPGGAAELLSQDGVPLFDGSVPEREVRGRRHPLPPLADPPFAVMRAAADRLAAGNDAETLRFAPADGLLVGGLDVSYPAPFRASAAAVVMRLGPDGPEPVAEHVAAVDVAVPYVPGYLAFRELPAYAAVLRKLAAADTPPPAVWLVDGNGRLHPRRAGVATLLGNLIGVPTVGVAKNLLCGTAGDDGVIRDGDEPLGAVLDERNGGPVKQLYISTGAGIGLDDAVAIAAACRAGRRLPEPVYKSDAVSRGGDAAES